MNTAKMSGNRLGTLHLTRVGNYDAFMQRWNDTSDMDEKRGLLHGLMEVGRLDLNTPHPQGFMMLTEWSTWRKEDAALMIIFLLEIADGYLRPAEYFHSEDDVEVLYDMRWALAQKAMAILCSQVFRESKGHIAHPPYRWDILLGDEMVFTRLVWFFRETDYPGVAGFTRYRLFNFPDQIRHDDHLAKRVEDFLITLTRLVWGHGEFLGCENREKPIIRERLFRARPAFLKIMQYLPEFVLANLNTLKLDLASRRALRKLAFRGPFEFPEKVVRPARNLEEAIYGHSRMAGVLNSYLVRIKARKWRN